MWAVVIYMHSFVQSSYTYSYTCPRHSLSCVHVSLFQTDFRTLTYLQFQIFGHLYIIHSFSLARGHAATQRRSAHISSFTRHTLVTHVIAHITHPYAHSLTLLSRLCFPAAPVTSPAGPAGSARAGSVAAVPRCLSAAAVTPRPAPHMLCRAGWLAFADLVGAAASDLPWGPRRSGRSSRPGLVLSRVAAAVTSPAFPNGSCVGRLGGRPPLDPFCRSGPAAPEAGRRPPPAAGPAPRVRLIVRAGAAGRRARQPAAGPALCWGLVVFFPGRWRQRGRRSRSVRAPPRPPSTGPGPCSSIGIPGRRPGREAHPAAPRRPGFVLS